MLIPFLQIVVECLKIYRFLVFIDIIMSFLLGFNMLNRNHPFIYSIQSVLNQLVEPALRPFRRIIPPVGGLDFSPVFLLLVLQFFLGVWGRIIFKYFPQ